MEIERKFLFKGNIEEMWKNPIKKIKQCYLSYDPEVRIREKHNSDGRKYYLTVKNKGDKVREEYEVEISKNTYEELYKNRQTNSLISKFRFIVPLENNLKAEVDFYENVYTDSSNSLKVIEVEFESEEQSNNFIIPKWFGREVTNDHRYKNGYIAKYWDKDNLLIE
jgi:CYTH domain-containing protein